MNLVHIVFKEYRLLKLMEEFKHQLQQFLLCLKLKKLKLNLIWKM